VLKLAIWETSFLREELVLKYGPIEDITAQDLTEDERVTLTYWVSQEKKAKRALKKYNVLYIPGKGLWKRSIMSKVNKAYYY
jgi:hypothetical protein